MPLSPKKLAAILREADQRTNEIIKRERKSRAVRAAALARQPKRIVINTQVTRYAASAKASPRVVAHGKVETAGYLLAIGDSWFHYPIRDVLTNLHEFGYSIESSAVAGDPIEKMVSRLGQMDKFKQLLEKVISLGAVPKAILISGGGDDIAGSEFGMLINSTALPDAGWDPAIVNAVLNDRISAAYHLMIAQVNDLCLKSSVKRTFPILVHGYDYPVADGRGFFGGWPLPGPWLKPGFDEKLFDNRSVTTAMMVEIIDRFNTMVKELTRVPQFSNVKYINLRGTLSNKPANYQEWWDNELHPTGGTPWKPRKNGFLAIAKEFDAVLATLP